MPSRIVRATGYSPRRDETYNPAIRDWKEAFRNYNKESKYEPMRANILDYIALIPIIAGFVFIFMGFLFGGILVPAGVFLELISSCTGKHKPYK